MISCCSPEHPEERMTLIHFSALFFYSQVSLFVPLHILFYFSFRILVKYLVIFLFLLFLFYYTFLRLSSFLFVLSPFSIHGLRNLNDPHKIIYKIILSYFSLSFLFSFCVWHFLFLLPFSIYGLRFRISRETLIILC